MSDFCWFHLVSESCRKAGSEGPKMDVQLKSHSWGLHLKVPQKAPILRIFHARLISWECADNFLWWHTMAYHGIADVVLPQNFQAAKPCMMCPMLRDRTRSDRVWSSHVESGRICPDSCALKNTDFLDFFRTGPGKWWSSQICCEKAEVSNSWRIFNSWRWFFSLEHP